ncbi:DUF397 domain-containing protein [Micromonospora tarensis]|uniref:DUF397 domain-containing protein n=1 Tax=Micromonospora tarensis TaxID=2806100 RepID=UPI0028162307|nr:DUF397 domain-containing protein [Micromonospora tarensis]
MPGLVGAVLVREGFGGRVSGVGGAVAARDRAGSRGSLPRSCSILDVVVPGRQEPTAFGIEHDLAGPIGVVGRRRCGRGGVFGVRDSKDPDGPVCVVDAYSWRLFVFAPPR